MRLAEPVRLAEGQIAASGAVLARAFADDPFFTRVLSDPVERKRLMLPFMTAWTRYGLPFGEVYVTAGPVEASAIWLPPDAVMRTPERLAQAGVTGVVDAFSLPGAENGLYVAYPHKRGFCILTLVPRQSLGTRKR